MGFYNVQNGDAPYFKYLADHYAMSDNFHQSVNGGTGANHIMFGHGDAIWFSDGKGKAAVPPHNVRVAAGTPNAGIVDEIENPKPAASTNNWYTEDGYGGGSVGAASYGGGSYSDCADTTQPGVAPIVNYLKSLAHVSILKFIEANWAIPTVTARSRDNFPNPIATADNPYVPTNSPALDDLMSMFIFPSK